MSCQANNIPTTEYLEKVFERLPTCSTHDDYVALLPWNLKNEIIKQNEFIKEWGGQFITMIPEPMIIAD